MWDAYDANGDAFLPCGSEGSLERSVWVNPDPSSVPSYAVSVFGDLRDYEDLDAICEWFERACSRLWVRSAVCTCGNGCKSLTITYLGEDTYHVSDLKEDAMITMYPTVRFKRVNPDAKVPEYATPGSAGVDLCSMETVTIMPHETVMVGTGIAVELPDGFFGDCRPRSGLASKRGITLANAPGTIDSDYRGEIKLPLHNEGNVPQAVEKGERCAQMIIGQHATATFREVDELSDTSRGEGGFGSTGR